MLRNKLGAVVFLVKGQLANTPFVPKNDQLLDTVAFKGLTCTSNAFTVRTW